MKYVDYIGFGVAGNFTGHLAQANEEADFVAVITKEAHAPKAIFPFYTPSNSTDTFLNIYPLSEDTISMPKTDCNVQIEPEIALICDISYAEDKVVSVRPIQFGAYNDCSIRRPGAKKISEKKNWGENSKGISSTLIDIDKFSEGGVIENYSITCFHESKGELNQYGEVSEAKTYSYFNEKLLDWVKEKLNEQKDEGPAENLSEILNSCKKPSKCILSIGATRYTEYGETNFLSRGDKSIVIVFDHNLYSNSDIINFVKENDLNKVGISALVQEVK